MTAPRKRTVFLSFASSDRRIAESIQLALLGAQYEVFFDAATLPAGSDYNTRIRMAIAKCDVYVFLISRDSTHKGRYVQTELALVKAKWPEPWGHVLPVVVGEFDYAKVDPYLSAVTFLEPRGNVAAEVAAALERLSASPPSSPSENNIEASNLRKDPASDTSSVAGVTLQSDGDQSPSIANVDTSAHEVTGKQQVRTVTETRDWTPTERDKWHLGKYWNPRSLWIASIVVYLLSFSVYIAMPLLPPAADRGTAIGGFPKRLLLLRDGTVWVGFAPLGSEGGGLARLNSDGHWSIYTKADAQNGLLSDNITDLAPGPEGSLWVATDGGLARRDNDGQWNTYTKANTQGRLPSDHVIALAVSPDGSLWVATDSGLARRGNDGAWPTTLSTNDGTRSAIYALTASGDSSLWVLREVDLARLDKDGRWHSYMNPRNWRGDEESSLAVSPDGSCWVVIQRQLARLDASGHWQTYDKPNTTAIAVNQDASVWVGNTDGELERLDKDGHSLGHWKPHTGVDNDVRNQPPLGGTSAIAVSPSGSLWVLTWYGGLAMLDTDGHWHTYTEGLEVALTRKQQLR